MTLFHRTERVSPIALGNRARDAHEWERAVEHYRAALAADPENVAIWVQYGHALKETGRHAQAEAAYRRAIDEDPTAADPHLQLGILLRLQGRREDAESVFLRAVMLDPGLIPSAQDLAEFGWTAERLAELRRSFVPQLPKPRRRASLITLGDRARDLGHWEGAARLYRKALDRNPRRPDIWIQYGNMLKETGKLAQAESAYRRALAFGGEMADAYHQLGHVLKLQGRTDEARAAYLRSFALQPSIKRSLTELAGLGWSAKAVDELSSLCSPESEEGLAEQACFAALRKSVSPPDLSALNAIEPRGSIAIVLHLFDPTLWDEMRQAIQNVSHPFDLFVSVTKGHSDHMRAPIQATFPHAYVFEFEDHGRDVGAFIVFLQSGVLLKYNLICKLHTKRSPHLSQTDDWPNGDEWRRALIGGVLGSPEIVDRIITNFCLHQNLGIVVADRNLLSGARRWAGNERWLSQLLPRIGYPLEVNDCTFPAGNIFWIRSSLLLPLTELGIRLQDFEAEPFPLDGTLGHAIERIFGLLCHNTGMLAVEQRQLSKIDPLAPFPRVSKASADRSIHQKKSSAADEQNDLAEAGAAVSKDELVDAWHCQKRDIPRRWSKSDFLRLAEIERFTGVTRDRETSAMVLELTNDVWRTNTVPSSFITDTMIAVWLDNAATVRRNMPDILSETDQYRLLAWYCCARPFDSGCSSSTEPVDPIIARMASTCVSEGPNEKLPHTALMLSIYNFRSDLRGCVSLYRSSSLPSYIGWYYCRGIREIGLIHHVSATERHALNSPVLESGFGPLSFLCMLALEQVAHPDFELSSREGRKEAFEWFENLAAQTEPFASLSGKTADRGNSIQTNCPNGRAPFNGVPAYVTSDHSYRYQIAWHTAEYFGVGDSGTRLLLAEQWFPPEENFNWSRAPYSSLGFRVSGSVPAAINIGLLFNRSIELDAPARELAIFVNSVLVFCDSVSAAVKDELILRVPGDLIRNGAANLLQFAVSDALVPAQVNDQFSTDGRELGVALRRIWIGHAEGNRGFSDDTTRAKAQVRTAKAVGDGDLLIVRGDLRSHTGYAKAIRSLIKLLPERSCILGVDIHPDPNDNEAPFPYPVITEADALNRVVRHPVRCTVLHCTEPGTMSVWPNARNIGWFFWETDTVPYLREWPLRMGLMDAIWAPTTFMEQFIRKAGYLGPVHLIPWPQAFAVAPRSLSGSALKIPMSYYEAIDDLWNEQRSRTVAELRKQGQPLFLAVQSLAPRKGLPILLSEWRSHITRPENKSILILRLAFRHSSLQTDDWKREFMCALLAAGFCSRDAIRIALIPTLLDERELANLYRGVDAFISTSYGEGFGGPVAEAVQNDCPVITPRHTGLSDLIPSNYPLIIHSERRSVGLKGNLSSYPNSATWHIPKSGELCQHLDSFTKMSPSRRRRLAEDCKKNMMEFCWSPFVRNRLSKALHDLDEDSSDASCSSNDSSIKSGLSAVA